MGLGTVRGDYSSLRESPWCWTSLVTEEGTEVWYSKNTVKAKCDFVAAPRGCTGRRA